MATPTEIPLTRQCFSKRPRTRRAQFKLEESRSLIVDEHSKSTSRTGLSEVECQGFKNGIYSREHERVFSNDGVVSHMDKAILPSQSVRKETFSKGETKTHTDTPIQTSGSQTDDETGDEVDGDFPYPFTKLDLLATVFSVVFFLYDYVSDIVLAEEYFARSRYLAFGFTAGFIIVPALISNGLSILWYKLDYKRLREKKQQNKLKKEEETHCCVWFCRVFFTMPFMFGPVVRHIEYIYHGIKTWNMSLSKSKRKYHYDQMLYEDNDASLVRMLESFLEAAPQLILQIFIILTEGEQDKLEFMRYIRPIAMLGSWVGLSWSLAANHRALRAMHSEGPNSSSEIAKPAKMSTVKDIFGAIGYFLWRACEVGPRVIILALFASHFTYYVLIAAGIHWVFMSTWLFFQKTKFYKKRRDEIFFNIVIGYVLIFCFINTRDGNTRFRTLIYYIVFYAENFTMLLAWVYFTDRKSDWFYFVAISVVSSGCVCQICFQLMYYLMCHPVKVDLCLSVDKEYFCFQSVCHELQPEEEQLSRSRLDHVFAS